MRRFKSKSFNRWARREDISDQSLADALERIEKGMVDADIGSGVFKQRVSRPGEGRSGGYRTIILLRIGYRAFFVHGFDKSSTSNIDDKQEKDFKRLASILLNMDNETLQFMLDDASFEEF
ncbi:MAG: type II toxin-antitoxin system RelE/ParE family toxin [Desulfovibrio sp.]|jgi:hypothetical protein|nr:type II toxin-antitoxin system RelE/ParE family toxin [Desulfovibrio sp.]